GTVTLNGPAPSGGQIVTLTSSNTAAATVPASITVAAGAMSATFTVSTTAVKNATTSTITATCNSGSAFATLTINPPALSSLSFNPTSVKGGATTQLTTTLTGLAPSGGIVVSLVSSAQT